jgi:hypothetical protein
LKPARKIRRASIGLALALSVTVSAGATSSAPEKSGRRTPCSAARDLISPSTYYGIDLVPTKRIPGTGLAKGTGRVTFTSSPFGVSVSPAGTYVYDLALTVERLEPPKKGAYTAWVSTPNLDQIKRLGAFDENFALAGRVDWNKFLVIVTLEPSDEATDTWQGPIILRGMSRSGLMHTLAGHGPYDQEPCATYGFP